MGFAERRQEEQNEAVRRHTRPRAARDYETPKVSPVHAMQGNLQVLVAPLPEVRRYPGYVRLGVPVIGSALLWTGILRAFGVI